MDSTPPDNGYLPPSSVQIKTAKTQKHLYCPVFTQKALAAACAFSMISYSAKEAVPIAGSGRLLFLFFTQPLPYRHRKR